MIYIRNRDAVTTPQLVSENVRSELNRNRSRARGLDSIRVVEGERAEYRNRGGGRGEKRLAPSHRECSKRFL